METTEGVEEEEGKEVKEEVDKEKKEVPKVSGNQTTGKSSTYCT